MISQFVLGKISFKDKATARLLLLLVLQFGIFCTPLHSEELSLVTYNIQGMRPETNWQVRLFFMTQQLIELNPDVICLQEINESMDGGGLDNMARTLAANLEEHFEEPWNWTFAQTHVAWDEFNEGVGIISRYPVIQQGFRTLATGVFPRKVVWNLLETPAGPVQVFSTHLSYRSDHGAIRLLQVQQIREYIFAKLADHESLGALLCGDFNTTPNTDPILALSAVGTDSLFQDAWDLNHPAEAGWTMPANAPQSRIDYIFSRGTDGDWPAQGVQLIMNNPYDSSHYTSDHLGVLAVFPLPQTAVAENKSSFPGTVQILSVYPNPFNPDVLLTYSLSVAQSLQIDVFDLTGHLIEKLFNGPQGAGSHRHAWRPSGISGGIYFLALRTAEEQKIQKLIYLP